MSKAHGSPLQHTWKNLGTHREPDISQEQKAKIVQLGTITEQLSRLSFKQAGSLFEEDGEFHIKTCLSRGLLLNGRHALGDIHRGPFKYEEDYYNAQISAFVEHVKYLPLGHHCFFAPVPARSEYDDYAGYRKASDWWSDFVTVQSKIDSSDNRADYVIVGEILSETITKWADDLSDGDREHRFVLHHPDLSVNNIYIDEDFNITCIIDWHSAPLYPYPCSSQPPVYRSHGMKWMRHSSLRLNMDFDTHLERIHSAKASALRAYFIGCYAVAVRCGCSPAF